MALKVHLLLLFIAVFGKEAKADCDAITDCETCTRTTSWFSDYTCRWCPCDQACHAFGAVLSMVGNICNSDEDVTDPLQCSLRGSKENGCTSTPDCDEMQTCMSCTRHKTWNGNKCRWCPLDRECHALGSLLNSCRANQNIVSPENCYDKSYGIYNPDSAFANTLLSAVAYSDDPQTCIDTIYPNSGFKLEEAIIKPCEQFFLFKYKECYAYTAISQSQKTIVLAFRGTDFSAAPLQIVDEFQSVLTDAKVPFYNRGEVQKYFADAHNKIMSCAKQSIYDLLSKNADYDVVVTGHSLGGAMASLAAMALIYSGIVREGKLSLYTFGMPRVGDKEYAQYHDLLVNNSWRVVHNRDIVSHLPFCNIFGLSCRYTGGGPFHHRTEIFYNIEYYMNIRSPYKICKGDEDERCSNGEMTEHWCTDLGRCLDYHKYYFQINVGEYCDEQRSRIRRSANNYSTRNQKDKSSMWHLLSEDKCTRIKLETYSPNKDGNTATQINKFSKVEIMRIDCLFLITLAVISILISV